MGTASRLGPVALALALALGPLAACTGNANRRATPPRNEAAMLTREETAKLATRSNAFAFDLYSRVRSAPGNLALSPASITSALAMTWGGARGQTEVEMRTVLHLDGTPDAVMTAWGSLSRSLQDPSRPLKLRIANRLFGDKTVAFNADYIERTRAAFDAPLEPVDFKTAADPTRLHINAWVEKQTERRIRDLLPVGAVQALTRLILVNAIYFLADWAEPFDTSSTMPMPFATGSGPPKQTPTMHHGGTYRIAKADGVTVLEMPYQGGDTAMLVILPDRQDGLEDAERALSAEKLEAWTNALTSKLVLVALPRFEVNPEGSLALGETLQALGMPTAFDREKADFTGMANPADPRERIAIDQVFHKAFVKVDEKGTEAAAATAVAMMGGGAPPKMLEFRADHPFLFAIVDRRTGLVLFLGRVTDPTRR
jgi:serpin B